MSNEYRPTEAEKEVEEQLLRHDQEIRDCFNRCLNDLGVDLYIKDYTLKKEPIKSAYVTGCCCCAAGYYRCPCNC